MTKEPFLIYLNEVIEDFAVEWSAPVIKKVKGQFEICLDAWLKCLEF